ncbi:MAG TPA: 30S ribosome-binding factor RbfA [Candidatus Udaeobacter sp.]|nr:30S ribosome-binding factor RbfA [Candidatus Udaeobacter sp.]
MRRASGSHKRPERVGDLLRDEIAAILRSQMNDPRLELVGVTAVEVAGDLQHARVYLSSLDPGADWPALLKVLGRASGFVRGELGRRRLGLKHLPELTFVPDRSIEHGSKIASILRELPAESAEPGSDPKPSDPREESAPNEPS